MCKRCAPLLTSSLHLCTLSIHILRPNSCSRIFPIRLVLSFLQIHSLLLVLFRNYLLARNTPAKIRSISVPLVLLFLHSPSLLQASSHPSPVPAAVIRERTHPSSKFPSAFRADLTLNSSLEGEKKMDSNPQNSADQTEKVCIVGSGNWGSAIATLVGRNCERLQNCDSQVNMWVFEEMIEIEEGSMMKLTDIINSRHENTKYLPGIRLPSNVVAVPDLAEACEGATLLIFVLPHQFLPRLLPTIRAAVHPSCRGVSLIKGLGKSSVSPPLPDHAVG